MEQPNPPIVITGGAQRLGLATALALKEDGHEVVITYRRERSVLDELRHHGIDCIYADFSEPTAILAFSEELKQRYPMLRAIIHNASEWLPENGDIDDSEVLRRMLSVHAVAPYLINQQCGELLRRYGEIHGQADIIHLSDYVASIGSKKHIAYAASKAALENMTLSFATKLAPLVKVNSIAPALLMFNQGDDAAYRKKALGKSLLGIAPGEAEGVNTIRYILDSSYLTGKSIALDGGRHLARAS